MPTIREWMAIYNRMIDLAEQNGIRRGPNNVRLRRLNNLRSSNAEAAQRVAALTNFLRDNIQFQVEIDPEAPDNRSQSTSRAQLTTFGVEIEALLPLAAVAFNSNAHTTIANALSAGGIPAKVELYNHFHRRHWKIITDNSLVAEHNTATCEIVSPPLPATTIGLEQVRKVGEILVGLHMLVNRSCGFHIHIGIGDPATPEFFKNLISLYHGNLPIIEQILAPSRRGGGNNYCRNLRLFSSDNLRACHTIKEVTDLVNGSNPRYDRYFKLNINSYHRYRTVEFRQHQGTIDPQKMVMWIRFCQRLVSAAAAPPTTGFQADTLEKLLSMLHVDEEERSYFLTRQSHFHQLETSGDL